MNKKGLNLPSHLKQPEKKKDKTTWKMTFKTLSSGNKWHWFLINGKQVNVILPFSQLTAWRVSRPWCREGELWWSPIGPLSWVEETESEGRPKQLEFIAPSARRERAAQRERARAVQKVPWNVQHSTGWCMHVSKLLRAGKKYHPKGCEGTFTQGQGQGLFPPARQENLTIYQALVGILRRVLPQ